MRKINIVSRRGANGPHGDKRTAATAAAAAGASAALCVFLFLLVSMRNLQDGSPEDEPSPASIINQVEANGELRRRRRLSTPELMQIFNQVSIREETRWQERRRLTLHGAAIRSRTLWRIITLSLVNKEKT